MSRLSNEIQRQIGLLIDRKGKIVTVIVGDHHRILIPSLESYRIDPGRLIEAYAACTPTCKMKP